MPLPTGTIAMSQVNVELSNASTALISLNDGPVRTLAQVPSGTISMDNLRGKSAANYGTLTSNFSVRAEGQSFTFTLSGGSGITNGTYYWAIDTSSNMTGRLPASSGAFTITSNTGSFVVGTTETLGDQGNGTFRVKVGVASGVPVTYVLGSTVTVTETVTYTAGTVTNTNPYRIGLNNTTQRQVTFVCNTTKLTTGTTLWWNTTTGVTTADLNVTSGTITTDGAGSALGAVAVNEVTNGSSVPSRSFQFRFYKNAARTQLVATSTTVTIRAAPTYSVSFSPSAIFEGQMTTLFLTANNVPSGYTLYFSWDFAQGGALSDLSTTIQSGAVSFPTATVSDTTWAKFDSFAESTELFYMRLRAGSTSGTILASGALTVYQALGNVTTLLGTRSGNGTPGQTVTMTLRIGSIPAYYLARWFSIDYSINGGAYTQSGLLATEITVPANSTSSSTVTVFSATAGSTWITSLVLRVRMTTHNDKITDQATSPQLYGFYL